MIKDLNKEQISNFLKVLENRFKDNMERHQNIKWEDVFGRLVNNLDKMYSLYLMEESGGEVDVVGFDEVSNKYIFMDCVKESPSGRRSLCYDDEALNARKANKPVGSAVGLAQKMGIEILNEEEYRYLQTLVSFDLKTSSWIKTPPKIRKLKGALFCDKRYDSIFVYHNGADSYYSSRGFRGILKV